MANMLNLRDNDTINVIGGFELAHKKPEEKDHMLLGYGHPCTRIAPGVFKVDTPFKLDLNVWVFPKDRFIRCLLYRNYIVEYMLTWEGLTNMQKEINFPINNIEDYRRCVC